jgi:hypothetical protein
MRGVPSTLKGEPRLRCAVNRQRYAERHGSHWIFEETPIDIRHFDLNLNLVSLIFFVATLIVPS